MDQLRISFTCSRDSCSWKWFSRYFCSSSLICYRRLMGGTRFNLFPSHLLCLSKWVCVFFLFGAFNWFVEVKYCTTLELSWKHLSEAHSMPKIIGIGIPKPLRALKHQRNFFVWLLLTTSPHCQCLVYFSRNFYFQVMNLFYWLGCFFLTSSFNNWTNCLIVLI